MDGEKQKISGAIDKKSQIFSNLSDEIWGFAETRFSLPKSADAICSCLEREGFSIQRRLCGMADAFIASYARGNGGPVIGILGEYDALPTMSQAAGSFERKPLIEGGAGHGCGHNALGAGSALAAAALKDYLEAAGEEKNAVIKYFGCPGEESGSGKAYLARGGAFSGVDAFLTWHPMVETQVWNVSSLANYQVWFRFKGRSAHAAAAPHQGRSALDACELMNVGVNYLREHVIPEARMHYAYTDVGGGAPNVVQSSAGLLYFIRAPRSSQVREIFERVVDIAEGAAIMTGTSVEVEWDSACSEYIVNDVLCDAIYKNMLSLGKIPFTDDDMRLAEKYTAQFDESVKKSVRDNIAKAFKDESRERCAGIAAKRLDEIAAKPLLEDIFPYSPSDVVLPGSTDVGDASWQAPTGQLMVGCFPAGTVSHSWQWVDMGKSEAVHKGLIYAGKVMAMTALDIIQSPDLLARAKDEWKSRLAGGTYNCAIPKDVSPK